jgi:hypothetical protein
MRGHRQPIRPEGNGGLRLGRSLLPKDEERECDGWI